MPPNYLDIFVDEEELADLDGVLGATVEEDDADQAEAPDPQELDADPEVQFILEAAQEMEVA